MYYGSPLKGSWEDLGSLGGCWAVVLQSDVAGASWVGVLGGLGRGTDFLGQPNAAAAVPRRP